MSAKEDIEELFKNYAGSPAGSVQSKTPSNPMAMSEEMTSADKPFEFNFPDTSNFDAEAFIAEIENMKRRAAQKDDKKALDEMHRLCLANQPLFTTVVTDEDTSRRKPAAKDTSFLITGFGLRNLKSLEDALKKEQREKLQRLFYKLKYIECHRGEGAAEEYSGSSESASRTVASSTGTLPMHDSQIRLKYLMGLDDTDWEEEGGKTDLEEIIEEVDEEPVLTGETAAMRRAQKYLRSHKIFEFFQFLIAHMLSDMPDNPIQFLMDLLDKCLMYRSGFGEAPLLYNKEHIQQLFLLMDPMITNFIEIDQYVTGMKTLGYCSYNKNPPLSPEGMVSKDFFLEEAYECGVNLLNDMIRRRWMGKPPPVTPPPPPTPQGATSSQRSSIRR